MAPQPFGISFTGTREQALARLDTLRDAAKANLGGHVSALADVVTEAVRATLQVAGMKRANPGEPRTPDENVDQYSVGINASAHVADDGGTNIYVSVSTTPAARVGTLAEGPTPNELAAHEARKAIEAAAARAATPAAAPKADTAPAGQPATFAGQPVPATPVPATPPATAPATTGRGAQG